MRFFLSTNPANLRSHLAAHSRFTATVEAEYGDAVVEGTVLTMAHHGPRKNNPAPCSYGNQFGGLLIEAVGLSHLDLDSIGGCAAILGCKPEAQKFWELAAFVDVNGAHKLKLGIEQTGASASDVEKLFAFWAWNTANMVYAERDGSVTDVTEKVSRAISALTKILLGDENMLAAGVTYRDNKQKLNGTSFADAKDGVITRIAATFVNDLYTDPLGNPLKAVVALNTVNNSITVSFAEPPTGDVNARTIVQSLWGELAGGHAGIAGSPRDRTMHLDDLYAAVEAVRNFCR